MGSPEIINLTATSSLIEKIVIFGVLVGTILVIWVGIWFLALLIEKLLLIIKNKILKKGAR